MIPKIHYQDDHPELMRLLGGEMAKVIETDTGVKSAASAAIPREVVEEHRPDRDHFLIHLVGMGSQESFGPNRNADGWPEADLLKRANTFVTHGHYFEEHRNRDPKLARGIVKYAVFDPKHQRVEMLVWGNIKKASEDYEAARAGKPLSFSMSARVKGDRCSVCHHFAKRASDHCEHIRRTPNRYLPEFKKYAFMINVEPTFFDISKVRNPADRIAHYIDYKFPDETAKAASADGLVVPGHDWAAFEGVTLDDVREGFDPADRELLRKLAAIEQDLDTAPARSLLHEYAKSASLACCGDWTRLPQVPDTARLPQLLHKLASRGILLSFPAFSSRFAGVDAPDCALPSLFRDLLDREDSRGMEVMQPSDCGCDEDDEVEKFMTQATEQFSFDKEPAQKRIVITISINAAPGVKMARANYGEPDSGIVHMYGIYKLATVREAIRQGHDAFRILHHACVQNRTHR